VSGPTSFSVSDGAQRWVTGVLAVLAVAAVGTAGLSGLSWYQAAHDDTLALGTARDTVLRDAQQAAVNFNTLDYRRVRDGLALWQQSATGSLLDEIRANRTSYAQVITDTRTATTAGALDGAVMELDERAGTARVLVGLDVTAVRNGGESSCVRRRIQLEMRRLDADGPRADPGAGASQDPGAGVPQDPGAGVPQDPGAGVPQNTGGVWKVDKLAPVGGANPVPEACPSVPLSPPQPGLGQPGPPR
jgi:Mce-associated membrane protein